MSIDRTIKIYHVKFKLLVLLQQQPETKRFILKKKDINSSLNLSNSKVYKPMCWLVTTLHSIEDTSLINANNQ